MICFGLEKASSVSCQLQRQDIGSQRGRHAESGVYKPGKELDEAIHPWKPLVIQKDLARGATRVLDIHGGVLPRREQREKLAAKMAADVKITHIWVTSMPAL